MKAIKAPRNNTRAFNKTLINKRASLPNTDFVKQRAFGGRLLSGEGRYWWEDRTFRQR